MAQRAQCQRKQPVPSSIETGLAPTQGHTSPWHTWTGSRSEGRREEPWLGPLLLVWWVWPARDILDWAGSETQKLGFVVGRFEIRFARAHESQAVGEM